MKLYVLNYVHEDDKLRDTIWNRPAVFRSAEAARQAAQDEYAEMWAEWKRYGDYVGDFDLPPTLVWAQDEPDHWYATYGGTHLTIQPVELQD